MKYFLFIVLLVAVVITAGCTSENKSTGSLTTTPLITTIIPYTPTTQPTPYFVDILQIKRNAQNIAYDDLFRYNEKYIGNTVYFRGKIVQITPISGGSGDEYGFRVATKESQNYGYSDDIIFVYYKGPRYLEGDTIDLWGKVSGLQTYTAVLGNVVTIPELQALYVELVSKASEKSAIGIATTSTPAQTGIFGTFLASDKIISNALGTIHSDLRYRQISDLTYDGTMLKNTADNEYAKFDANDEYAKYLFQVSQLGKDLNKWGQAWDDHEKQVALTYADNSARDIDQMSLILYKMKSSDKYSTFSADFENKRMYFDDMKQQLRMARDYTNTFMD